MEPITTAVGIGGASVSGILGYFLKRAMNKIDKVETLAYKTKAKLDVVESDYLNKVQNLNDKFDLLNDNIKDLTQEIKELNRSLLDKSK